MTDSPADVLQHYLVARALGTLGGADGTWPVFSNGEPSSPDNCVTVYDTAGIEQGRPMIDGGDAGPMGVQVRVRAVNHATGWAKIAAIKENLESSSTAIGPYHYGPLTVNGRSYRIQCVLKIADIAALGKALPQSRLSLFTLNALIRIADLN